MFIDRKEVALVMALMPVFAGCNSKETPIATIPTLPTSTSVSETATPPTETTTPQTTVESPATPAPTAKPVKENLLPKNVVFEGNLTPRDSNIKKGSIGFLIKDDASAVMTLAVSQPCEDGQPLDFNAIRLVPDDTIEGAQFNYKWSNVGTMRGRLIRPDTLSGFVTLHKWHPTRNCPEIEFIFIASQNGNGVETFTQTHNRVRQGGQYSMQELLAGINRDCPQCKLSLDK